MADGVESDPLTMWADLLLRLRAMLSGLSLSGEQFGQIAWHVKSCRYSTGDLIVQGGVKEGFWALVVCGTVAAHSPSKSTIEWLVSREPAMLIPRGSDFGEGMLLRGDASPCTYRAASDVELFVLRRSDLVAATGQGKRPEATNEDRGRTPWAWLGLVLIVVLAIGAWIGLGGSGGRTAAGVNGVSAGMVEPSAPSVALVFPADRSVVMSREPIYIEALVTGRDVSSIDLLVDGRVVATQSAASENASRRSVRLAWMDSQPGSHVLAIQSHGVDGGLLSSGPVTVSVVPAGRLAFTSNRNGVDAVYQMNTDGTEVRLQTTGPGACRQPALHADGGLAFVSEGSGSGPRLRWLPAGEAEAVDLFPGRDPAWAPSGERLAFARSVDGVSQVLVARAADWSTWQLTAEGVYAGQPTWSPDGLQLAYVAEREGNLDIWVADTKGGQPVRLTEDAATDWAPAWSPDGSHLAFVSDRSGQTQVYSVEVEPGAAARQVTDMELGAESPAWSPDGYWLAVVAYTGDGAGVNSREIYLMMADGSEVVRLTSNSHDDTHPAWVLR